MSKPLTSYPEGAQRDAAARARVANPAGGIGKVAAQDYLARKAAKPKAAKVAEVKSE